MHDALGTSVGSINWLINGWGGNNVDLSLRMEGSGISNGSNDESGVNVAESQRRVK